MAPTVEQLFDLSGRVALVTGGAGFLGQAICAALAEAGARVVVGSRDLERGQAAADQLPNPDQAHLAIVLDHKDETSLANGFANAVEQAGQVDILINNGQGGVGKDWTDFALYWFGGQLDIATGYFLLARGFREHLFQQGVPVFI
ncbi:MAG: SDR family NAD(P)-dependent oxidoreductase, partial [Planctomycetaceae bacterium]|nr:SDR family NAD(P)-dependent oxidoreductase [Planctomycetaceae bacterium]